MGHRIHKTELVAQSDPNAWRDTRFDPVEPKRTHRQRLMLGTAKRAVLWGIMPRPPVEA